MKVEAEEIFGPVLTVTPHHDVRDAIKRADSSRYGLQGSICTNSLPLALEALDDWDVGGLIVNDVSIFRIDNMPFGGWKDSFISAAGIHDSERRQGVDISPAGSYQFL